MSTSATSTPEPGQILAGKYLVEEVLGVGGMGVVVAAKHIQLDQRVAIKYLLPSALLNPEVVERFAREARAAAKIRGEHVARVIDVGQFDDGAPFMVLEYLEGHDLAKHLEEKGPLPVEDTMRWILETCEALAEAHAAKIVHRDLKPSNLFLSTQPDRSVIVKVLDFGISKTGDAPSASLTKTSALMGTAFYMSPEQLTNPKGVDHRSDIWSLGVILYELLAGRPPFLGESVPEIIGAILQNEPEGLRTIRPDISLDLELVIAKCMQSKAAARYQSVAALAAALGPFARVSDRASIDITARVLGESLKPPAAAPEVSVATLLVPASNPAPSAISPPAPEPASAAPASVKPPAASGGASAVGAVTTHGLSTSAITTRPKRTPVTMIAALAVVVVAGIGTIAGIKMAGGTKAEGPPAGANGLVSGPSTGEATSLPAASAGAAAATTTAVPPAPASAASAAPPPTASASAASAAAVTPAHAPTAPVATARNNGAATAAPAKSVVNAAPPGTPATAAPASSQVAAPSSSSSKNPLQMGIK